MILPLMFVDTFESSNHVCLDELPKTERPMTGDQYLVQLGSVGVVSPNSYRA